MLLEQLIAAYDGSKPAAVIAERQQWSAGKAHCLLSNAAASPLQKRRYFISQ